MSHFTAREQGRHVFSGLGLSLVVTGLVVACGARVPAPDDVVTAWAEAIGSGRCGSAARLLEPGARAGLTEDEWATWCEANLTSLRAQSDAIRAAHADGALWVTASLPMDVARDVELVHDGARWALAGHPPLPGGGDDPVDALESLAAALSSDAMRDVLAVLSAEMREQYRAEIGAVVDALIAGRDARVHIAGEFATVDVGDITVRLVRESGVWRIAEVDQAGRPPAVGYYD